MVLRIETVAHGAIIAQVANSREFVELVKSMCNDGIKPIKWELVKNDVD